MIAALAILAKRRTALTHTHPLTPLSGVVFFIGEIISYNATEGFLVGVISVFIKQLLN
jgi:hypothetical protein